MALFAPVAVEWSIVSELSVSWNVEPADAERRIEEVLAAVVPT